MTLAHSRRKWMYNSFSPLWPHQRRSDAHYKGGLAGWPMYIMQTCFSQLPKPLSVFCPFDNFVLNSLSCCPGSIFLLLLISITLLSHITSHSSFSFVLSISHWLFLVQHVYIIFLSPLTAVLCFESCSANAASDDFKPLPSLVKHNLHHLCQKQQ